MLREGEMVRRSVAYAEVTWRVDGPGAGGSRVDVARAEGGDLPRNLLVRPAPSTVVVTALPYPLTVSVVASDASPFPATSSVRTSINLTLRDGSREQVVLEAIDVTGLSQQELVQLEPDGDEWCIRASAGVEDVDLVGLPRLAYYAARRSAPRVPPGSVAGPVPTVAVDTSASMGGYLSGGAVATVMEVLTGLYSWAYGTNAVTPVWTFGATAERLSEVSLSELGPLVQSTIAGRTPESGASHRALIRAVGVRPARKLLVVSDGVPGDSWGVVPALEAATHPLTCTYLLLARSAFDSDELARPAADRDELVGLSSIVGGAVDAVSVRPEAVGGLAADARGLDLFVERLTRHVLV